MREASRTVMALVLVLSVHGLWAGNGDRLYGTITTRQGRVLEGPIRWDRNEASWLDILDAYKKTPEKNREAARRAGLSEEGREIRLLGIRIAEIDGASRLPSSSSLGIRFGHIRSIEPLEKGQARLILKSGQEVILVGGSDIGGSVREIVVEDAKAGKVKLAWREIELVEFKDTPESFKSEFGARLFGTLVTKRLGGFQGWICWDVDEIFSTDILDGEEKGKDRKIPFGEIASIARRDSDSSIVTLKNGETMVLSGTNDVDEDNRGILAMDPALGVVRVGWDDFERLVFEPAEERAAPSFDGGRPLRGRVWTETGGSWEGLVRWDNDEEFSWEILDGEDHGVQFEIEFAQIARIEKSSRDSSVVTLRDGRSFELTGGNDVDSDNKGIFVRLASGEEKVVPWKDFRKLEFQWEALTAEAEH